MRLRKSGVAYPERSAAGEREQIKNQGREIWSAATLRISSNSPAQGGPKVDSETLASHRLGQPASVLKKDQRLVTNQSFPIPINFKCLKCGGTEIVVSDDYADDSMTSCKQCGQEFGAWADVKAKAKDVTKKAVVDQLKRGFGPGWKWK